MQPEITYLEVFTDPACTGEQCSSVANLRVELKQPPDRPLWLRLYGSYPTENANAWTFYPMAWSKQQNQQAELLSAVQLSVPLAGNDNCVDIQIYGVEGRPLFDERRCEPDRCAVYNIVAARNSGGGPGGSPVDVTQIPEGSCDAPPVLSSGVGGIVYLDPAAAAEATRPDADAGPVDQETDSRVPVPTGAKDRTPKDHAANGCSVSSPGSTSLPASLLITLFPLLLVRRRQRSARKLLH